MWILPRGGFSFALLAVGLLLLALPWLLGFADQSEPLASATIIGGLLTLVAIAGFLRHGWTQEGALTLGAWSMVAPFVVGFADRSEPLWAHVAAGAAAILLGVAAADWRSLRPPGVAA